jgi:hypothetical protein
MLKTRSWVVMLKRDHVVGERLAGPGIGDRPHAAEEGVGRVEQLAEVTAAHGRCGHGAGHGGLVPPVDPLLRPEEEHLAAVGVELAGEVQRSPEREPEIMVAEGGGGPGGRGVRAVVARPGVGIEGGVPEVLADAPVEGPRPALGDEADLAGGGAAVLGRVVGGEDLHLLHGVHVLGAQHRAGRAGAGGDGAVHHHDVLVVAAPVDAEVAVGHAVGGEGADGSAAHARLEQGQEDGVAPVERQLLDLTRVHRAPDLGAVGLHAVGPCLHLDRFREGAQLHDEVHAELAGRAQPDAFGDDPLEAGQLGGDGVAAHHQVREHVVAAGVGDRLVALAASLVGRGDGHAGHHGLRAVPHEARDLPGVELRPGRRRQTHQDQHGRADHTSQEPHPVLPALGGRERSRAAGPRPRVVAGARHGKTHIRLKDERCRGLFPTLTRRGAHCQGSRPQTTWRGSRGRRWVSRVRIRG